MIITPQQAREAERLAKQFRKQERAKRPKKAPRVIQNRVEPAKDGKQRQPRERAPDYLNFIRRLPCVICTLHGETPKQSQAAHVRAGYSDAGWRPTGMQEKPSDYRTLPLCAPHHVDGPEAQHRHGERDWWASHGIYPPDLCADLMDMAPDAEAGKTVIIQHCVRAMSAALRKAKASA